MNVIPFTVNTGMPSALIVLVALAMLSAGCNTLSGPSPGEAEYRSVPPPESQPPAMRNGAIYQAGHELVLFEDVKARRIGDVLTILLRERTDAEKESSTNIEKESNTAAALESQGLSSTPLNIGGIFDQNRSFGIGGRTQFRGGGNTDQSNLLRGEITVTVANVLPNGNLEVQGEKWIEINNGEEYIRLRGIVRPADIGPNNTVLSPRVANARIAYSGKGDVAKSNIPSLLTRFFIRALFLI